VSTLERGVTIAPSVWLNWLADLPVSTGDVWVDEAAGKVYAVYRGDLLRFPSSLAWASGGDNRNR
jgi:hypothetical protein